MDPFEESLLELFDNVNIRSREQIQWCDFEGRPSSEAIRKPFDFICKSNPVRLRCLQEMLFFRQPEYYASGEILHHYEVWDHILTRYRKREEILR